MKKAHKHKKGYFLSFLLMQQIWLQINDILASKCILYNFLFTCKENNFVAHLDVKLSLVLLFCAKTVSCVNVSKKSAMTQIVRVFLHPNWIEYSRRGKNLRKINNREALSLEFCLEKVFHRSTLNLPW